MRTIVFFFLVLLPYLSIAQSQNIIPNPSFEEYINCPNGKVENNMDSLRYWFSPTLTTPDYLNTCVPTQYGNLKLITYNTIPLNKSGFQWPKSGNAFIGLVYNYSGGVKEYVSVKLLKTLKKEERWHLSFYVSLAGGSSKAISASDFEAYFSKGSLSVDDYSLSYQAQTNAGSIATFISDTNWVRINLIYEARGGERYLTIGSFKNPKEMHSQRVRPLPGFFSYYYMDDVSMTKIKNDYDVNVDSLWPLNSCYDSIAVKIDNWGDKALDFNQHPLTLNVLLKQGEDTVQQLQKTINNNSLNPNGLPLPSEGSFTVNFATLQHNGNASNYIIKVEATMGADTFLPNNTIEVPGMSIDRISISQHSLCLGDSVLLYSENVNGTAEWQFSSDLIQWKNIGYADTLMHYPQSKGYYRLTVCNKVISDTLAINLSRVDIAIDNFTFYGQCQDSMGVRVTNKGCFDIDFSRVRLGVQFRLEFNTQQIYYQQFLIDNNQRNPLGQPLAPGGSFTIKTSQLNYSLGKEFYRIFILANMYGDTFFLNNIIVDTTYYPIGLDRVWQSKEVLCKGDSIVLYAHNTSDSAVWQFSSNQQNWQNIGSGDSLVYYPTENGYFRLSACQNYSDTLSIKIEEIPPKIDDYEFEFCSSGEQLLQLDSNVNIAKLNWYKTSNGKTPFHQGFSYLANINQTTKYYLESENNGCVLKERGVLKVTIGGCTLEIPNVFTPNGDGINDVFKFHNAHGKTIYTKIFDRWGNKVAAFENNIGWDGKGAAAGTYYYVIETAEETYKGTVVLIR